MIIEQMNFIQTLKDSSFSYLKNSSLFLVTLLDLVYDHTGEGCRWKFEKLFCSFLQFSLILRLLPWSPVGQ